MRLRGTLVTLVVLLAAIFAVFNWQALVTSLSVNFLLFRIEIPLALTLLGLIVVVSLLFFLLSLLERAGQLRQITQLERQLETLRGQLEKRRLSEFATLEQNIIERLEAAEQKLSSAVTEGRTALLDGLAAGGERRREQAEQLEQRVLLLRDELAADIAQVEDALRELMLTGQTPTEEL